MSIELSNLKEINSRNTPKIVVELTNPTELALRSDKVTTYLRGTIVGKDDRKFTLIKWKMTDKEYERFIKHRYWEISDYSYSEYENNPQIILKDNTSITPIKTEEMEVGIKEDIKKLEKIISVISNEELREIVRKETIEDPKFIGNVGGIRMHHTKNGQLVTHVNEVAHIAYQLMKSINSLKPDLKIDQDLLIAGAVLHDLGKKHIYNTWDQITTEYTFLGLLREHLVHGAIILDKYLETASEKVKPYLFLIQHIMLAHHGKIEYGSPVVPAFIEAKIISQADNMSAFLDNFMEQTTRNGITGKMFVNEGKQMLTPEKVQDILTKPEYLTSILNGLGQYSDPDVGNKEELEW